MATTSISHQTRKTPSLRCPHCGKGNLFLTGRDTFSCLQCSREFTLDRLKALAAAHAQQRGRITAARTGAA